MLNHVLIPLDGSRLAEQAIYPIKHLLRPEGQITLLTVIQGENDYHWAQEYLEPLAARLKLEGFRVQIEIQEGDPPRLIVERAARLGVDLIAMCTHGRSGLEKLLFGSVTGDVLSLTVCPVLVVPNRVRQQSGQDAPASDPSLGWTGQ
jgi:nucleotide-binding universal stress UspA family protein